jgi:O-acetyl-ADP-ribose deacetylase (regulator of RNase III)
MFLYLKEKMKERITIFRGDITKLDVDVIVNAAQRKSVWEVVELIGAIHRAAGRGRSQNAELLRL